MDGENGAFYIYPFYACPGEHWWLSTETGRPLELSRGKNRVDTKLGGYN